MIILFGKRKTLSGTSDVFMYECPYCGENNTTIFFVYTWYIHMFWIPILPISNEGHALCSACKASRDELRFGPKLVAEYKEHKNRFRDPWWTWSLTIGVIVLVLAVIIF